MKAEPTQRVVGSLLARLSTATQSVKPETKGVIYILVLVAIGFVLTRHHSPHVVLNPTTHRYEFADEVCVSDCAEEKRGYDWAAERNLDDPKSCTENSDAFRAGCTIRANEMREYEEDQSNDDPAID